MKFLILSLFCVLTISQEVRTKCESILRAAAEKKIKQCKSKIQYKLEGKGGGIKEFRALIQ